MRFPVFYCLVALSTPQPSLVVFAFFGVFAHLVFFSYAFRKIIYGFNIQ